MRIGGEAYQYVQLFKTSEDCHHGIPQRWLVAAAVEVVVAYQALQFIFSLTILWEVLFREWSCIFIKLDRASCCTHLLTYNAKMLFPDNKLNKIRH